MASRTRKSSRARAAEKYLKEASTSMSKAKEILNRPESDSHSSGTDGETGEQASGDAGPSDLLRRATALQKRAKKRVHGGSQTRSSTKRRKESMIKIPACYMRRKRSGLYSRDGELVECEVDKYASYEDVTHTLVCQLKIDEVEGTVPSLFRSSGARILNESVKIGDDEHEWTLCRYMAKLHYGPEKLRIGVGLVEDEDVRNAPTASRPSCITKQKGVTKYHSRLTVLYAKHPGRGEQLTRESVWRSTHTGSTCVPRDFFPENVGFVVSSVTSEHDGCKLLSVSTTNIFAVHTCSSTKKRKLEIAFQSPPSGADSDGSLLCLSSTHNLDTRYEWFVVGISQALPSSPVIYPVCGGVYGCTVHSGGKEVESELITVEIGRTQDDEHPIVNSAVSNSSVEVVEVTEDKVMEFQTMEYTQDILMKATNNKDQVMRIGGGGFGEVFRGTVQHTRVAIKFLNDDGTSALLRGALLAGENQLKNEVATLYKWRHPNLLPLMGYCVSPPAIVYELMVNGSLFHLLHTNDDSETLTWSRRVHICHDTSRGLAYLHAGNPPLVHQDIKSHNILVDECFNAKIGDFGFSIELPQVRGDRSMFTSMNFARTEGYYPSEVAQGYYSPKSDVFSLGVVTLEVYTGCLSYDEGHPDRRLVEFRDEEIRSKDAFKMIYDGKLDRPEDKIVDTFLNVVQRALKKHSTRCDASQVLNMWDALNL